jgi:hypothetical protein
MYSSKKNEVKENTGITIESAEYGTCNAYILSLKDNIGIVQDKNDSLITLNCGRLVDLIFEDIFKQQKDYSVFIVDFDGITSVTEDFLEKYLLYYLESKFKILNVNMSLIVEAAWSSVVDSFFVSQYENTVEVKTGNKEVSTYYCND